MKLSKELLGSSLAALLSGCASLPSTTPSELEECPTVGNVKQGVTSNCDQPALAVDSFPEGYEVDSTQGQVVDLSVLEPKLN